MQSAPQLSVQLEPSIRNVYLLPMVVLVMVFWMRTAVDASATDCGKEVIAVFAGSPPVKTVVLWTQPPALAAALVNGWAITVNSVKQMPFAMDMALAATLTNPAAAIETTLVTSVKHIVTPVKPVVPLAVARKQVLVNVLMAELEIPAPALRKIAPLGRVHALEVERAAITNVFVKLDTLDVRANASAWRKSLVREMEDVWRTPRVNATPAFEGILVMNRTRWPTVSRARPFRDFLACQVLLMSLDLDWMQRVARPLFELCHSSSEQEIRSSLETLPTSYPMVCSVFK
mmetsp:Transcript_984/g.2013  ORF Transcript_984/g.2013 Transcript_984/m.2013 type:complete len:288 (+) Transcript_984:932-1795(+)